MKQPWNFRSLIDIGERENNDIGASYEWSDKKPQAEVESADEIMEHVPEWSPDQ
jgi:hypothetical protein